MANITSLVAGKVAKIGLRLADFKKNLLATLVEVPVSTRKEATLHDFTFSKAGGEIQRNLSHQRPKEVATTVTWEPGRAVTWSRCEL